MKRLLYYTITFLTLLSFSQQVAICDFENLPEGDVNGQDEWLYSSSLSSIDNGSYLVRIKYSDKTTDIQLIMKQ